MTYQPEFIHDHSTAVKQFTEEAGNMECPKTPQLMTKDSVKFIIRMVMSELDELACTVTNNDNESSDLMHEALNNIDKCHHYDYENDIDVIGAQGDALVDSWYYSLNCAAKHGINLDRLFSVVHQANMDKRDPETGKFLKRNDGKIIKPVNWHGPDINGEIQRQMEHGSWS